MVKRKRTHFEYIVITVVVILTLTLGAGLYAGRLKIQKSKLLVQELSMMRSALLLYKTVNYINAETLDTLTSTSYPVDDVMRPYIDRLPLSKNGKHIDPFGNPYNYDNKKGWVWSTTSGYERW